MTATIGGNCVIFGISNLFFDEEFNKLSDKEKVKFRKKIGHHWCEIWFGEYQGDGQIFRIKSPSGPRLKMTVERLDEKLTKSTITDRRNYSVNLKGNKKPKHAICENYFEPSFKDKNLRERGVKLNPTLDKYSGRVVFGKKVKKANKTLKKSPFDSTSSTESSSYEKCGNYPQCMYAECECLLSSIYKSHLLTNTKKK
jgi:hypothetical protein